ncbi:MAG TPA: high-potential iron-sulfur protein [Usitatibacter sp.]|nr:high-potential iron-sulfur protein [Usitatibacter sp.]
MDEKSKLSRRSFFRGAATVAGAAVAASVIPVRLVHAQTKSSKESMKYQDHPNNGSECSMCAYFQPPHSCAVVDGDISPNGWCVAFAKKG